jgi:flagellar protein FliO/FliZ
MDFVALLRMLGSLGIVLGILVGALWVVRRYGIRLPGLLGRGASHPSRLALVETLAIDARRSVALIRCDGAEHLLLLTPEGHLILAGAQA